MFAPLRLSLGLRRLDLGEWLDVDQHYAHEIGIKQRLLARRPGEVVAHLPAGDAASQETLGLVRAWMADHHPRLVAAADQPGLHPVDAAGRLVQEDLCILTRDTGTWRLTAASVCFPSRWRLHDKIGAPVAEIHDPVPGYRESISDIVDRTLDRLDPQRPLWRRNWSILDDPALFQPETPTATRDTPPRSLCDLTLRVERQTLRRLPVSSGLLFTIRTYRRRLDDVVTDPRTAGDLAGALRTCPPELAKYRGWTPLLGWLIDTLEAQAAKAGPNRAQPG